MPYAGLKTLLGFVEPASLQHQMAERGKANRHMPLVLQFLAHGDVPAEPHLALCQAAQVRQIGAAEVAVGGGDLTATPKALGGLERRLVVSATVRLHHGLDGSQPCAPESRSRADPPDREIGND